MEGLIFHDTGFDVVLGDLHIEAVAQRLQGRCADQAVQNLFVEAEFAGIFKRHLAAGLALQILQGAVEFNTESFGGDWDITDFSYISFLEAAKRVLYSPNSETQNQNGQKGFCHPAFCAIAQGFHHFRNLNNYVPQD